MVRNVVFEPTYDHGTDWIAYALQQIDAAFTWNRPAIISTHRVNFCGHIEEKNRRTGIGRLTKIIKCNCPALARCRIYVCQRIRESNNKGIISPDMYKQKFKKAF